MAIELWAAVDSNGDVFCYDGNPTWDGEKFQPNNMMKDYTGGFLAKLVCRDLKPGEKARVVSIDLANDVVVLDKPETVEQKFARVMEALREWHGSGGNTSRLWDVYRDLSESEVKA